ncbi:hypothetical protein ACQKWADRAFT_328803 [Trichoderma austrokoningii]
MASCGLQGRPDMYGLGIRLAIYIQWFGEILVEFYDEADVSDIRLLGLLLSGGIILGLLVAIASQDVQPADAYIMLQLAAGCYIFLIPIYIWNLLSCCDPKWDPLKWTGEIKMPVYGISNVILLIVISAVGIWFFATYIPTKGRQCEQYGFFFAKIKLDNAAFIVVNIAIYVAIILICVAIALSWTGFWDGQFQIHRRHRRRRSHRRQRERDEQERIARRKRARQEQKDLLRTMRGISNLVVYGLHIAAIELTLQWNQFDNINAVNTSAQTIPLLVSLGILLRLVVSHYATRIDGSADSQSAGAGDEPLPADPEDPGGCRCPRVPAPAPAPAPNRASYRARQARATPTVAPIPELEVLNEYVAGMDMDDVSEYFAHGSDPYWLARMAIQNRQMAERAAAMERQRARGTMPRPARVHVRG